MSIERRLLRLERQALDLHLRSEAWRLAAVYGLDPATVLVEAERVSSAIERRGWAAVLADEASALGRTIDDLSREVRAIVATGWGPPDQS